MTKELAETRLEFSITPSGSDASHAAHVALTIIVPSGDTMDVPFDPMYTINRLIDALFSATGEELDGHGNGNVRTYYTEKNSLFGRVFLYCSHCATASRIQPALFEGTQADNENVLCPACQRIYGLHYRSELSGDVVMEYCATYGAVRKLLAN